MIIFAESKHEKCMNSYQKICLQKCAIVAFVTYLTCLANSIGLACYHSLLLRNCSDGLLKDELG